MTPWTRECQASPSFIISRGLLRFMSTESVVPSNHLILCRLLLLLPSVFPSIRVFPRGGWSVILLPPPQSCAHHTCTSAKREAHEVCRVETVRPPPRKGGLAGRDTPSSLGPSGDSVSFSAVLFSASVFSMSLLKTAIWKCSELFLALKGRLLGSNTPSPCEWPLVIKP